MRFARASLGSILRLPPITVALLALPIEAAKASDSFCEQERTSLEDRQSVLDSARGIARQRRVAPETFRYCSYRRLSGLWDWAIVETTRRKQKDESTTWLLIACSRRHGKSEWTCAGRDKRAIQVPVTDETGAHELEVELANDETSPVMDASLARQLVLQTLELADRSTATVPSCDRREEAVHPQPPRAKRDSWDIYNATEVRTDGPNHWRIGNFRDGSLSFSSAGGPPTTFEVDCWTEGILVLE